MLLKVILLLVLGIVLIVKGGDWFVDAASWMAEASGIPKLIIGATVVSVATTLPEMLVSIQSALQGKIDMSIGNAVGSVTANIGLIMAISIVFMGSAINRKDYLLKSILMILASLIVCSCGFVGHVSLILSIILIIIWVIFMYDNIICAIRSSKGQKEEKEKIEIKVLLKNILLFIVGACGIVFGADLLVDNGSELARMIGVSERIIGVTIIAIGTSLPELVTTITAIIKKQSSLSVGNILGANIMDLSLILPISSLISGQSLPISKTGAILDLPACLLVGLIAVVPAMVKSKFMKWQGYLLLVVYIAYVAITCSI